MIYAGDIMSRSRSVQYIAGHLGGSHDLFGEYHEDIAGIQYMERYHE